MKRLLIFAFLGCSILFIQCSSRYEVSNYLNDTERDSLLTDIITYVYVRPKGTTWENRFDASYRKHYVNELPKFTLEKLYKEKDDTYYFLLIRPARSAEATMRAVGGKFRLNETKKIIQFEEIFNTPVGAITVLKKKGEELFLHMVENGNVEKYMLNDDYLEWPNAWTYYDTVRHEWLTKPGY
jgi:hypothetical protein